MSQMFQLKESPSELAVSSYVKQKYLQIPCTRDVTGDNFPKGQQVYRWEQGGTTWVDFSKSFFRIRGTWSRPDGSQLTRADGIAPAMGACANLFQSLEFRINGTVVSRVSDFVAQVDALEARSTHGQQWLDGVGASTNFYQASFADRQAQITSPDPAVVLGRAVASVDFGFDAVTTITITTAIAGGISSIVFNVADAVIPIGSVLLVKAANVVSTCVIIAQTDVATYLASGFGGANVGAAALAAGVLAISPPAPDSPPTQTRPITSLDFGFAPATTVQVVAAAGTLIFSAASPIIPDGYVLSIGGQVLTVLSSTPINGTTATNYIVAGATANFGGPDALAPGILTIYGQAESALFQSQQAGAQEMIWQPPLSIFKVDNAMPTGQYEFYFNPQIDGVYQQRSIESVGASKVNITDFRFVINDLYFWACTMESERIENKVYLIDLMETRCQPQLLNNGTGYQQKQYDISPSTVNVSLAVQANNAGSDSRLPATMFKAINATDLNLRRLMIQYAGDNKPSPDADPVYIASQGVPVPRMGVNWMVQRYAETFINANLFNSDDSAESIYDWQTRGPFYLFDNNRDASDRSTRLITNTEYNPPVLNANLLAFDSYRVQAQITISQSRVVDVQVSAA